jgi:N-carbamoyl-L-amino-acid hydrolase
MMTSARFIVPAIVAGVCLNNVAFAQENIIASPERMEQRIQALSEFGANPEGGVSRIAFSDADIAGREYIKELMRDAGLDVRVDTAGNIIGRRAGREDALSPILFGSHIDSVPGGGNYDGDVGVIAAIEVIELLNEHGAETRHPLEVVNFTDEEGGLTGSRAMVGKLTEEALQVVSHSGLTIGEGIKRVPSGAGHDAQDFAHMTPTGMIFVPSVDGISHSPKEFTSAEDMANGASVLLHTVLAVDSGALDSTSSE